MEFLVIVLTLLAAWNAARAKEVPLPRAKPTSHASLAFPHRPSLSPVPHVLPPYDAQAWPSDCDVQLEKIARFVHQPSLNGPTQCGASDIVRLESIVMPNGVLVAVMPAATLRCPMAEAVAQWVRSDLGPATAELGSPLAAVTDLGSYDCRGRNNQPSAKISEHGKGNALDLGVIKLVNGATIDLTKTSIPRMFRQKVREGTCNRFNTVRGPGSDAYHINHVHIDLAVRAHGFRMCQWDLGEPAAAADVPVPVPRPVASR